MGYIEVSMKDVLLEKYHIEKAQVTVNANEIYRMKSRNPRVNNLIVYSVPVLTGVSSITMAAISTNFIPQFDGSRFDLIGIAGLLGVISISTAVYSIVSKEVKINRDRILELKKERVDMIDSVIPPSNEELEKVKDIKVIKYTM